MPKKLLPKPVSTIKQMINTQPKISSTQMEMIRYKNDGNLVGRKKFFHI